MSVESSPLAQWPTQLQSLVAQLVVANKSAKSDLRGDIWVIVQSALSGYIRFHSRRLGPLSTAEIFDISAEKSLDMLLRIDSSLWKPAGESIGQVKAMLSTVARNGVVDVLRKNGRTVRHPEPEELVRQVNGATGSVQSVPSPAQRLVAQQFISCLHDCVQKLNPRARKLWFFRAMYELPSKCIAAHPEIQMNPGNVDVALQRSREQIGRCMAAKDMKLTSLPPGTFSDLWELCTGEEDQLFEEVGHG